MPVKESTCSIKCTPLTLYSTTPTKTMCFICHRDRHRLLFACPTPGFACPTGSNFEPCMNTIPVVMISSKQKQNVCSINKTF